MSKITSKRKAASPCVSNKTKIKNLDISTEDSLTSLDEFIHSMSSVSVTTKSKISVNSSEESFTSASISMDEVDHVMVRVATKNNEPFIGQLTRKDAFSIWKKGLNLPGNLVYGIALIFSTDKPFMIKFQLHEPLDLEDLKQDFKILIDEQEYAGVIVLPKPPPPKLGEPVVITITRTRFNLNASQINQWIQLFGTLDVGAKPVEADDVQGVKTDDFVCTARIRKHIPGVLPAFGRRMLVRYPGQPLQCNSCYEFGHLKAKCENAKIDWASYVSVFLTEKVATPELIGKWFDILKKKD